MLIALAVFVCLSLFSYDRVGDNPSIKELDGLRSAAQVFSRQFNNQCGPVGAAVSYVILYSLGYSGFFIALFFVLFGIGCFPKVRLARVSKKIFYIFVFVLILGMVSSLPARINHEVMDFPRVTVGGWAAATLADICLKALGGAGSYVLLVAFLIMLAAMITPLKPSDFVFLCKRVLERFLTQGRRWRELRRIHRQRVRREKELKAKEKSKEKSRQAAPVTRIAPSAGADEPVSALRPVKK